MQPDGNAVTYRVCDGKQMWATDTNTNWIGDKPTAIELNADGHLEMYNSKKQLLWSTEMSWTDSRDGFVKKTENFAGSVLKMENDGSLCLWKNQQCIWKSGGRGTSSCQTQQTPEFANAKVILRSGSKLKKGAIIWSANRSCKLTFKQDGDLILKQLCPDSGLEIETWSLRHGIGRAKNVGFKDSRGEEVIMSSDGEFVLNGPNDSLLWKTWMQITFFPYELNGSELRLRDDCEMCIYKDGACLWTVHSTIWQCPAHKPVVEMVGWKASGNDGKVTLANAPDSNYRDTMYPHKIEEMVGWKASGNDGKVSLGNTPDSITCLENCQADAGCRWVSYNHNTETCEGYSGTANPSLSRDVAYSIITVTAKKFYAETGVDYGGDDIQTNRNVYSSDICKQLCTVHPLCNVATYGTYGNEEGFCWLKSKTNLNRNKFSQRISYIS